MEIVRRYLTVLPFLVRLHVRSELEYRGAFLMDRLAQIITYGAYYAAIYVLLVRFGTLAGWTWPEMALLFSMQILTWALGASLSFVQFRNFEELVRLGTFDTVLVKPMNAWAYIAFAGFNPGYAGHVLIAGGLMVWSLIELGRGWGVGEGLYLALALVNGGIINCAIVTIIGATALIIVRSSPLVTIFLGFWELSRFPISIYPVPIQFMLLTIVPLGFTNYVPIAYLLGKDVALVGSWGGPIALVVGPLMALLAVAHWRYAISRYQGGGG